MSRAALTVLVASGLLASTAAPATAAMAIDPGAGCFPEGCPPDPVHFLRFASSGPVDWDAIAQCESHGNWSYNGASGFWGGLQFKPSSWFGYGGGAFDGIGPFPYSREEQITVAERVLAGQGIGAWPHCGRLG